MVWRVCDLHKQDELRKASTIELVIFLLQQEDNKLRTFKITKAEIVKMVDHQPESQTRNDLKQLIDNILDVKPSDPKPPVDNPEVDTVHTDNEQSTPHKRRRSEVNSSKNSKRVR